MKKQILLYFIIIHFGSLLNAQTVSSKLSGSIIGSSNLYDYNTNLCTSSTIISSYAFDGNLQTIFGTCDRTGGWIGLDLGEPYVITKISYCPKSDQTNRMVLGVFEGANQPDFGDAIPIYLVKTAPTQNVLTSISISCSRGFRYVRYVGPVDSKCNVSEIEFYGYKGGGDNGRLTQTTNIPTVIIHTTNAQDIIDKENYIKGYVSIVSENGSKVFSDSLEIKGRGNFSWNFPKKPYKMKLYKKASLLGMPAVEKNWTLINNYGDKTLMRNLLANDMSKRLEIPYTPAGIPVDVFLNGEYKGTYQLCDQVEVATNRVQVDKMATTAVALPDLSGGYLIEMDAYANEEKSWFTSSRNAIPVTIKYPKDDEIVLAQSEYIKKHFGLMEDAFAASNFTNSISGYRKYIDTETFIRHFLVGEFSGNTDTYWSTNMYKRKNDDKFYFGPVWDFDIAYENDNRTYPINKNSNWICTSSGSSANGVRNLINRILSDETFLTQMKAIYAKYRNNGVVSEATLLKTVDDYATMLQESQQLNFTRWNIMNTYVHQNPVLWGSYAAEVNNVKNYIKGRLAWMDTKLSYVHSEVYNNVLSQIYQWTADNMLHVEGLSGSATVQVIDVGGRILLTKHAETSFSTTLKKGIYFIRVNDQNYGIKVLKSIVE